MFGKLLKAVGLVNEKATKAAEEAEEFALEVERRSAYAAEQASAVARTVETASQLSEGEYTRQVVLYAVTAWLQNEAHAFEEKVYQHAFTNGADRAEARAVAGFASRATQEELSRVLSRALRYPFPPKAFDPTD